MEHTPTGRWVSGPLLVAVVCAGFGVGIAARERRPGPCGDQHPLAVTAVPPSVGFRSVSNMSVPPDCGAQYRRAAVFTAGPAVAEPLLAAFAAGLDGSRWRPSACAHTTDLCFRSARDHLFLAARERSEASSTIRPLIEVTVQPCDGQEGC